MANRIPWVNKPPLGSSLNTSSPFAQGMVRCYLFNEGGGKKIYDAVTGTIPTAVGTSGWTTASQGSAKVFTAANSDSYSDAGPNIPSGNTTITLEWWSTLVTPSGTNATAVMLGNNSGGIGSTFCMGSNNRRPFFYDGLNVTNFATTITDGALHQMVAVYNKTNVTLYIDGRFDSTVATTINVLTATSFTIGVFNNTGSFIQWHSGNMSKVTIWKRALSGSEIAQAFIQPFAPFLMPRRRMMTGQAVVAPSSTQSLMMVGVGA